MLLRRGRNIKNPQQHLFCQEKLSAIVPPSNESNVIKCVLAVVFCSLWMAWPQVLAWAEESGVRTFNEWVLTTSLHHLFPFIPTSYSCFICHHMGLRTSLPKRHSSLNGVAVWNSNVDNRHRTNPHNQVLKLCLILWISFSRLHDIALIFNVAI